MDASLGRPSRGDLLLCASRLDRRIFASCVRQGGKWPWDLCLTGPDGTEYEIVTGARGLRAHGYFHNAIDVGAPRGTPIRFVGYVPWETATVLETISAEEARAPERRVGIRNAGSVLVFQSIVGRLRITRKIYHANIDVRPGQIVHRGDLLGRVWDHGRTRRRNGRRGNAPHVHYEVWVASVTDGEQELGTNMPLSRLECALAAEVRRLALQTAEPPSASPTLTAADLGSLSRTDNAG